MDEVYDFKVGSPTTFTHRHSQKKEGERQNQERWTPQGTAERHHNCISADTTESVLSLINITRLFEGLFFWL